ADEDWDVAVVDDAEVPEPAQGGLAVAGEPRVGVAELDRRAVARPAGVAGRVADHLGRERLLTAGQLPCAGPDQFDPEELPGFDPAGRLDLRLPFRRRQCLQPGD